MALMPNGILNNPTDKDLINFAGRYAREYGPHVVVPFTINLQENWIARVDLRREVVNRERDLCDILAERTR